MLYGEIDKDDFYRGAVEKESRSLMNATYRLPSEELEQKFLAEAAEHNLVAFERPPQRRRYPGQHVQRHAHGECRSAGQLYAGFPR
ncbi:MAG: hypothetical protein U5K69_03715 [Balneolaceae bacterium]|nr:hypothetical protein [Balneolaceae bacterium]